MITGGQSRLAKAHPDHHLYVRFDDEVDEAGHVPRSRPYYVIAWAEPK